MNYLIVGNSAAGVFAAEAIRQADSEGEITILTDEAYQAYSRCLTSYYIGDAVTEEELYFQSAKFYDEKRINLLTKTKAMSLDCPEKIVRTAEGLAYKYDKLLIATGATPKKLKIPGAQLKDVFYLRTLDDAKAIRKKAQTSKNILILGAGLVSLKVAYNLLKIGMKVKVLVSSNQILSQILDLKSAEMVQKILEVQGMEFLFGAQPIQILADSQGSVEGVLLADDQRVTGDMVLVGKGVSPKVDWIKDSGIVVYKGIFVNEFMETTVPDIYAAGDVVETYDFIQGQFKINAIWPNASRQGRIAGLNMAGNRKAYEGSLSMNAVDFFGTTLISVGITKAITTDYREDIYYSEKNNKYRKLVYLKDKLVGYILLGDIKEAGQLMSELRRC